MTVRDEVLALDTELRAETARSDARLFLGPGGGALRLVEIAGSLRFAGILVRTGDLAALVTNGRAPAGRSLEACNAIADYAAAVAYAAGLGRQRRRQPLVRVEEIVALHAVATRRSSFERPGKWRSATAAALRGGAVPPPAWLVPRDVAALVERFANPPAPERLVLLWLADYHARLSRIHPFATANGRVTRLCLNLLLIRLGYPPFVIRPREGPRFASALDRAAAGDLWPSALFLGRSLRKSLQERGDVSHSPGDALVALSTIEGESERAALYKASQRGRLRTIRRGTSVFTSKLWIDEYRSSRAPAGRPRATRPLS
jgi:hypothetical protein